MLDAALPARSVRPQSRGFPRRLAARGQHLRSALNGGSPSSWVNPRANRLQIAQHVGDRDAALGGGDLDAPAQGQRDVDGQVGSVDIDNNPQSHRQTKLVSTNFRPA
jgi:hypothetical protein